MVAGKDYRAQHTASNELFASYVQTTSEEQAEQIISRLVSEHAAPLIDEIIRFKMRSNPHDGEDLRHDIVVALLSRLRRMRISPDENPIESFRDYVAVVTYNACKHYFIQKFPQREVFKNRLRYILKHDPELAFWKTQNGVLCGWSRWKGRADVCPRELLEQSQSSQTDRERLKQLFRKLNQPVRMEDLVDLFVGMPVTESPGEPADPEPKHEAVIDRLYLENVWSEIKNLPVKQRIALLLSLRDENENGILVVFPAKGIASARQIAEMLEMPPQQFAVLWKDLPLDDMRISQLLSVTRQQVINLRKCARERLGRRFA